MSKSHRRHIRQERAKADQYQTIFGKGCLPKTRIKTVTTIGFTLDVSQIVMCPFCLYQGKLQQFLISTKKGISQSRAQCPECKNGMIMKSLTTDMTPEEYAEWCFAYSASGFWRKVPFERWKSRLAAIGWAQQFWDRYKELKGDSAVENYEDYVIRTQEEAHQHDEDEWE